MATWVGGDVEVNGLRLHYTRTGGGPPVVLAHGITDDGLCWTPVAQALAPEYDVIMVDARGHGQSDAPETGYGPREHAADLAGVIAALGLRRPALLGHSMGAATTLVLAATHPDVPRSILLEDPPAWWKATPTTAADEAERWASIRAWITQLKGKTREALIAEQRAATPGWADAELGPWADAKLRLNLNVVHAPRSAALDWPSLLRRITCPALLITGDPNQGAIVTEADAATLKTLIPQLRVAQIPLAGHSIRRDQYDRYIEVVRSFLAETR